MTMNKTSIASESSSSSSTAPHGLRTQLGHILPKHALFQVHLLISKYYMIRGVATRAREQNLQAVHIALSQNIHLLGPFVGTDGYVLTESMAIAIYSMSFLSAISSFRLVLAPTFSSPGMLR